MKRPIPAPVPLALAAFACVAATVLAGCASRSKNEIHASGQIEITEVRVASKVGGTVAAEPFEEGDHVARAQLLAVIDTVDLDLQRRSALGDRDQARASLALLEAGARIEDVRAADAEVARRAADLTGAERDLERMQSLLDSGSVSEKSRDDARVRRDMARASHDAAREALARLRRGSRPEELAAARAALARSQARLDAVDQQIRDCRITAPLDGTVTARLVERGELVTPGAGIAVVGDLARPWLTVFVDATDLPRIRIGDRVRVTTDAPHDAAHAGRVSYVASTAEFTPRNVQTRDERAKLVYRVKVLLPNPGGALKPGMPADAVIYAGTAAGAADSTVGARAR